MPNWRRAHVPGGSYFFTLVTDRRAKLFRNASARAILGSIIRRCLIRWPFRINALVLLPDHLHTIWTLPRDDDRYSTRWGWMKKEFTKAWIQIGGVEQEISTGRRRERRRGVWQPKFWEHTLESEEDFERHFDYVHYNPVKHGHVRCPYEWPWSTFHGWVKAGVYPKNWACWQDNRVLDFDDIKKTIGE